MCLQYFVTAAIEMSLATTDIWGALFLFLQRRIFFHKWDSYTCYFNYLV